MPIKLYLDLMSQPSRALYILLKHIKYDFEPKFVNLRKGEHLSDEFSNKVNRLQLVPVIDHNGFILPESVAILNYLSREGIIPDSLFPKESKQRARVDEYLEWQHIGFRLHLSMYFRVKHIDPLMSGIPPNPKKVLGFERRVQRALEILDTKWLGRGTDFITGNTITVADLWAICELEQPRMAGFETRQGYKNISTWYEKVRAHFNPYYDEAHVILNKVAKKYDEKVAAKL